MTKDEALKLALEALERGETELRWQAITAIKEALSQPEQGPVAWVHLESWKTGKFWPDDCFSGLPVDEWQPLYTTPPQRKPLTDEQIILIVADCASSHQHTDIHFARAIEAAHGIKE